MTAPEIREALIALPHADNQGSSLENVAIELGRALCGQFGGYTRTTGIGAWISPAGHLYQEPVWLYSVATSNDPESGARLRQIARAFREVARQETIYLRLPSGAIEFIGA